MAAEPILEYQVRTYRSKANTQFSLIGQVCYIPALSRPHTSCETIPQYLRYGLWMSIYLKNLNEYT
jgi:hypothetical protein